MFDLSIPWWEFIVRTIVVYVAVLALLRVSGKREIGQMAPFDLVVILVIANAVQNSMNGGDVSLLGGLIAAATLVVANLVVGRVLERIPFFERVLRSDPTVLIHDGKVVQQNLDGEGIRLDDIERAARERGIATLADVSTAILETDGSISIIDRESGRIGRSRRMVRQIKRGN